MSVIIRGAKSAVRNPVRTASIVLLLGVATAFALSLLLANQAVKNKLNDLKTSGATTLTLQPAGSQGFQGGGDPLTDANYDSVKTLANVSDTSALLSLNTRRQVLRQGQNSGTRPSAADLQAFIQSEDKVGLESSIDAGTLGTRNFRAPDGDTADGGTQPAITIPVSVTGVSGGLDSTGTAWNITSGTFLTTQDGYEALVSTALASKNSLQVGSTFKAYDKGFTVIGIYQTDNQFNANSVVIPLKTAQVLGEQTGEVSTIIVKADSIENISAVESAIKDKLGSNKVDVTSAQQNTEDAINSLKSVERISIAGVVIAVLAAGAIVFLIMIMIVRERRREIAVLKAIGSSNIKIVGQFVTEAVVLTLASVIVGMVLAFAASGKVTSLLVTTNTKSSATETTTTGRGGFRANLFGGATNGQQTAESLVKDVKTDIGLAFLLEGLGAVILIGALGSAIPAFAISKVRPAEVMRGE